MTEWQPTMLFGAVLKSEAHGDDYATGKRIVDVVCQECGERLAAVHDDADAPTLHQWAPQLNPPRHGGEKRWSVAAGPLPDDDTAVVLHCFDHGHGIVDGRALRMAVEKYRDRGRRVRVRVPMGMADDV